MKIRSPWAIRIAATLAAWLLRAWMSTMRVRMCSLDGRQHPLDVKSCPSIYAFWHEGLLAPLALDAPVRILVSQHADGELITQVAQRLRSNLGVVRGSPARGGVQALLEMIRGSGQASHLLITPDGPRGPRRELKPGLVMVASLTGLPVVPVGIGFTRAWRARSWDRFALPKPFSTLVGVFGEPIVLPPDLDRGQLEAERRRIGDELVRLTLAAEDWAERLHRDRRALPPAVQPADLCKAG